MIRNLFRKAPDDQPQLFGATEQPRDWRGWIILALLLFIPAAFYGGYRTGASSHCEATAPEAPESTATPQFRAEFVGRYALDVGGHRGFLIVYVAGNGAPAATLQFSNWGKRVPEPLWNVSITGRTIAFLRTCAGARCAEIGASAPFRQIYTGEMMPGDREIRGTYMGGQSASSWKAVRY